MSVTPRDDSAAPSPASADRPSSVSGRLFSLDALRGFDMCWILGVEAIVHDLAKATQWPVLEALSGQLEHKSWAGFAFYDLIFPLFVFIAGVSLVFSLSKQIETKGRGAALRRVIVRSVILFLLGILYYGGFSKTFADVRLLGVLQRIALCYLFAGLLFCFLRARGLAVVTVAILLGYWLLMAFVPVPGVEPHSFDERQNLANYIDAQYLPGRKWDGDHDPEGLLSTLPAVASCLLGVLAGLLLRNDSIRPQGKVLRLLVAGAIAVALGLSWGTEIPNVEWLWFPVVKKTWTSSFVLVAGGYSAILLGLFYLVLDIWRWRWWAMPFVWIGTNAITLYLLDEIIKFHDLAERFAGGELSQYLFGSYAPAAISTMAVFLLLLIARFLYKRQTFLRV